MKYQAFPQEYIIDLDVANELLQVANALSEALDAATGFDIPEGHHPRRQAALKALDNFHAFCKNYTK